MPGWWTTFTPQRTAKAFLIAVVLVPSLALLMKALVEHLTDLVYEIHWFTTVPALILLFTIVMNRLLNEYAARSQKSEDQAQG